MPKDKENVADFLNNISDKPDLFKEETVEPEEEVEDKEDKPLPFHEDPKVQRYVEKQIQKALKDVKPSAEREFRQETKSDELDLPPALVRLVGNDTDEKKLALREFASYLEGLKGAAKQEFIQELEEQQQHQVQEDNAAVQELDEAFENIEDNYGVDLSSNSTNARQLRTQFVEYVRKIAPKNEDGEVSAFPDLDSAFEEFQERNKRPSASRAKELASRGMTRSTDTSTAAPQGRSWKDVDKFFSKLKSNN